MNTHHISIGGFSLPLSSPAGTYPADLTERSPARANTPGPALRPPTAGQLHIGGFRLGDTRSSADGRPPASAGQPAPTRPVPAVVNRLRLLAPAAAEPAPWRYWVQFSHNSGRGGCEVRRTRQITSGRDDVEAVAATIASKIEVPHVTVTTFTLLSAPPAPAHTRRSRPLTAARRAATAAPIGSVDPQPWHYWIAFEFLTGRAGGGACEVDRQYQISSGDDLVSINALICADVGRPVRVIAHTLLTGSPGPVGPADASRAGA